MKVLYYIRALIPQKLFVALQPFYHYLLAFLGALRYGFPSRKIIVVGITGTKGKSSTVELVNTILEEAGFTTALSNTIRFKIGEKSWPNRFKMTMPGRFFIQRFLRSAVEKGCRYAILEMTSEGVVQFRHAFVNLDALIFTNLAAEHIEAHGSYEKYVEAKLKLATHLEHSPKKNKVIVSNIDDKQGKKFLDIAVEKKYMYSLETARPYTITEKGNTFTFNKTALHSPLLGIFNIYNALAAATFAESQHIDTAVIKKALATFDLIEGRVEKIDAGQNFTVIVDYAHTKESLEQLYTIFKRRRKICVLGNTGGGRDKWKRPEMGRIADRHCAHIILTNEDPYDEDPKSILDDMAHVIHKRPPEIIMDRRVAIRKALSIATTGDVVLITGKGTDPYMMGPGDSKVPWSDKEVAQEELRNMLVMHKEKRGTVSGTENEFKISKQEST